MFLSACFRLMFVARACQISWVCHWSCMYVGVLSDQICMQNCSSYAPTPPTTPIVFAICKVIGSLGAVAELEQKFSGAHRRQLSNDIPRMHISS
jgi:hypothetical protein